MPVTHVQFLTPPVADHARARDFYVGKLGFGTLVDRRTPEGGHFVMVAPKGARTGVVLTDRQVIGVEAGPRHFRLQTTDLDGHSIGLLEAADIGNRPR
ncbi:VOC family protein [Amycolatopsis sp. WQ 127309]|uniref:VOC family protein n=1 Tax=Amycolatopsis sp. WQ 127309 TaxID=2932773 RepID=UPI001FF1904A|nr:VOC family protein [Amycolatopsis sp. WQ 127309]UOZ04332.1 glyoxalase [Amycolatopsis sp. WQ 127309]